MNDAARKNPGRILALLLIPVLLYCIYLAGRWGLADVYARPAIIYLREWQRGERQLEDKDWDRYAANLKQALKLDPENPEILQWLGLAVEGKFVRYAPNYPYAYDQRHEAADYYRKSVRLRPTWPHTWSDLALVKYRLDEIDAELFLAIHKAVEYGPWEPGIQNVVSELGILLWEHLPDDERKFILQVMQNGLLHPEHGRVKRLMDLITRRGFLPKACAEFASIEKFQQYCAEHLAKPQVIK